MSKLEGIIFDLDGTLVDSKRDIGQSIAYVIKEELKITIREESVYPYIGGSLRQTLKELSNNPSEDALNRMVEEYKKYYFTRCDLLSRPFPDVPETLEKLNGYKKAVATSKLKFMANEVLKRLGIIRFFDAIIGGDFLPLKPAPDTIIAAAKAIEADPKKVLVVGDTEKDILAAKNAGSKVCVVTYGIKTGCELAKFSPDFMIDKFRDILKVVEEIEKSS